MRKFVFLALVAVIIMAASTVFSQTAATTEITFHKNGLIYVDDVVVKTITSYNPNAPVYLVVGEHQLHGRAPVGNAWLQDPKMQKYWSLYQMVKQGQYWIVKVPAAFMVIGYVRFNIGQATSPGNVRWAQIHNFQGDPSYFIDGPGNNALIVNVR